MSEWAGPERDMISLRDGMGSGWDGKFFRRLGLKMLAFWGNGFLRDRVKNERSQRDTTAILIVRMPRIFLHVPKRGVVFLVRGSPHKVEWGRGSWPWPMGSGPWALAHVGFEGGGSQK